MPSDETPKAQLRVLVDRRAIGDITSPPERFNAIQEAVRDGRLELLWTHITVGELVANPDPDERARLTISAAAFCRFVPTAVLVLDCSGLDLSKPSNDGNVFEAFQQDNPKHTRDAILASTTESEQCALLTHDRTLTYRATQRGLVVWRAEDLTQILGAP